MESKKDKVEIRARAIVCEAQVSAHSLTPGVVLINRCIHKQHPVLMNVLILSHYVFNALRSNFK